MILDINSVYTHCGVECNTIRQVKNNKILKIYAQNDAYVSQNKLYIKGAKSFLEKLLKKELFAYVQTARFKSLRIEIEPN